MLKDKRIIIFDLDGTAVDSPKQKLPSARLAKAVKDLQKTHRLCAATGRPWAYARPVLHGLGLTEPCIISSGTQICDPATGRIIWQNSLDFLTAQKVANALKSQPELRRRPESKVLVNNFSEDDQLYGGIRVRNFEITDPTYFINVAFVPDEIVHSVLLELSFIDNITCTKVVAQAPGFKDIHITTKNATKEHATIQLLGMIGVENEVSIGVGDGHNDLHLFNAVEYKVAMGNAVEELKSIAHEVIESVEEDGLASFFERLHSAAAKPQLFSPNRNHATQSTREPSGVQ